MKGNDFMFISNVFIGDIENLYSYKNGASLVEFFNMHFSYNDVYKMGFPPRRIYVADKLSELFSCNLFDKFLNICLSKQFIVSDSMNLTETEALERQKEILNAFNKNLLSKGYQIYEINGQFFMRSIDENMEQIGDGGFANVYINKLSNLVHKKLKDEIASDRVIVSRFKREYEITKSLQDIKNIIKVYDFNSVTNEYTMEYCDNNLFKYISENNVTESQKIKIALLIVETMSAVHKRNIIHRDLSPTNILFSKNELKIADFGLGKNLDMIHSHKTIYTNMFGQYQYCDPEQYMSLKEGDIQSDVYSLGRIINFIFTNSPLDSNHFFKYICEKAVSSDRNYRYMSASEMLKKMLETIERKSNNERENILLNKLSKIEIDEEVEEWIYEMDGVELCKRIISDIKFYSGVLQFIKTSNSNAKYIIDTITENYKIACKNFADYDVFANIAHFVLNQNIDYEYNEKSCRILNNIAYNINRFNIQHLIDKIIKDGIEPVLEDILIAK